MIVNILGIPYTVEEVDRIDPDVRMFGQIELNDHPRMVHRSTL